MVEEATLTRREAARFAGVHYNTIRSWEKQGKIEPLRIMVGGVPEVRIPVSQVVGVMEDRGHTGNSGDGRLVRPLSLAHNQEAMEVWRAYEDAVSENRRLNEELAAAQVQVSELRASLDKVQADHQQLLTAVLEIAQGKS